MHVLSLCSGGGGLDLGLRLAVPDARTVLYVENEVTACGVLVSNMEAERLDPAPIWTDLLTFDGKPWRGVVDWVIGGYPCQPFSNAGKRLGADDPRHLWPHVARIVADVAPRFCFFENVGAHLRLGFREVARDLQGMGYTVAATLSTASEVGAPHGRERLFILAYSGGERRQQESRGAHGDEGAYERRIAQFTHIASGSKSDVADTERSSGRSEPRAGVGYGFPPGPTDSEGWRAVIAVRPDLVPAIEPPLRGMADGMARGLGRADQLHILGNGVVPHQAAYALRLLMEAMQ